MSMDSGYWELDHSPTRAEKLAVMGKKKLRREIAQLEQQVNQLGDQLNEARVVEQRLREQKAAIGARNRALRNAVRTAHTALGSVLSVRNGGSLDGSIPTAGNPARRRHRRAQAPPDPALPEAGPV